MIIIGNLNEIDVNVETYDGKEIKIDKAYSIVRSNKKTRCENIIELAPDENLYSFFLNEKKNMKWTKDRFDEEFVERYFKGINNPYGAAAVKRILLESKDENIFIGCFCANENMCHRLLLGAILKYYGGDVVSTTIDDKIYDYYVNKFDLFVKGGY